MAGDRPIDKIRDGAVTMDIVDADDKSGIRAMIEIGGKLHIVKEKGIYEVALPDEIDPGRTNAQIPSTYRRVLNYGSDDPYVGRLLLTANGLFREGFLPQQIDYAGALVLAFDCLKDLIAMREMCLNLVAAQKTAEDIAKTQIPKRGAYALPSIPDIVERVEVFLLKAKHAVGTMNDLSILFFGNAVKKKKWVEALLGEIVRRVGDDDPFAKFLRNEGGAILMLTAMRNAVEHPQPTHRIVVCNYTMRVDMTIAPPSVELVHPETPHAPVPAVLLMQDATDRLSVIAEVLIANCAAIYEHPSIGAAVFVHEIPSERRRFPTVRYGYAIQIGDTVVPFGG